ncbi:AbrB/MazE/SpoVT family DNA-binding domain-containing protein [Haloplanus vescus]|uniref:AbrB/MazE/SpoVT family DNA-binding domain-containing protein n=1 Tax=Haloplanus vescus TaxID=555874 RepID=UPI000B83DFE5|nr:AbrB/MazE/SpoVT family DNA-binding domain-containing protein [Haloplanus vescus]
MPTIDSKGRIILPQRIRERLCLEPGTEVTVRTEDGKVIVEPEADPQRVLDRLETLVVETAPTNDASTSLNADIDPIAQRHRDAVRRGAEQDTDP